MLLLLPEEGAGRTSRAFGSHEPHGESQGLAASLERQRHRVWLHDSSPAEPTLCRVCIIGCVAAQQRSAPVW
jgi:hypothetical protein